MNLTPIDARPSRRQALTALALSTALVGGLLATPAVAAADVAQPPVVSPDDGKGIADIVVTARRVQESSQKVPIALTAISDERLKTQDIRDLNSLQRITPGVTICCTAWNNNTLTVVRGIQQGSPSYFGDVPVASSGYGNFFDITSVQALKGPQGTLFGQAAVAGAFLYQPRTPGETLGGYVSATAGSYDRRTVEGAVDLPLVNDHVFLRMAGISSYRRGYIQDLSNNVWYGDENYSIIRPTLTVKFDRFENTTMFQFMDAKTTGESNGLWVLQDINFNTPSVANGGLGVGNPLMAPSLYTTIRGLNGGNAAALQNLQAQALAWQLAHGPYQIMGTDVGCPMYGGGTPVPGPTSVTSLTPANTACPSDTHRQWTWINKTSFRLSDNWTLRNIFGWNKYADRNGPLDLDNTPLILNRTGSPLNQREFSGTAGTAVPNTTSDEFQLIGKAGIFDVQVGTFHIWRDLSQGIVYATQFTTNVATSQDYTQQTHAIYGQVNAHLDSLLPGLTATAGLRYNIDQADLTNYSYNASTLAVTGVTCGTTSDCGHKVWRTVPYTVGLQYQVNPRTMLYVTNARSYNAGGLQNVAGFYAYNPAQLNNIEAGVKSTFNIGTMPVRLNASYFRGWFNDVQVTVFTLLPNGQFGNITRNAAKAIVEGLEGELTFKPTPDIEIGGNAEYLANRYTSFPSYDVSTTPPTPIDLSSSKFTRAPRWKISLHGSYTPIHSKLGDITLTADYSYISQVVAQLAAAQPYNPANPTTGLMCSRQRTAANGYPTAVADGGTAWLDCKPGNSTLDLNATWKKFLGHENIAVTFAITNVTKNIWSTSQALLDRSAGFTAFQPAVPRMWTVKLRYDF